MTFAGLGVPKWASTRLMVGRAVASDDIFCTWPPRTTSSAHGHSGHWTWQCAISSCRVSPRTTFMSLHFQRHCRNWEGPSTPPSRTSPWTCSRWSGKNGEYCLDICRATRGALIKCIYGQYEAVVIACIAGENMALKNRPIICAHLVHHIIKHFLNFS